MFQHPAFILRFLLLPGQSLRTQSVVWEGSNAKSRLWKKRLPLVYLQPNQVKFHIWRAQGTMDITASKLFTGREFDEMVSYASRISCRKVVDHLVLFKMKDDFTEAQEKEMLDNLWSLQFQIKNILSVTVGRLLENTPDGYTHGLYTRFPTKEALDGYMDHPVRLNIAKELGLVMVDYEAHVEDDIEAIFRRGENFEQGFEHFVLLKFKEDSPAEVVQNFENTARGLYQKIESVVQLTAGTNFSPTSKLFFTHGVAVRLLSEDAYTDSIQPTILNGWSTLVPHLERYLVTGFLVAPTASSKSF